MRKEDMALMIVNQSQNNKKLVDDMQQLVGIGMAMKRQRDWYLKLCRKKNITMTEAYKIIQSINKSKD